MDQIVKYLVRDVMAFAVRELTKNGMPGAYDRYAVAYTSLLETGTLTLLPTTIGKVRLCGELCIDGDGFRGKQLWDEYNFRWSEIDGEFSGGEKNKENCVEFRAWKANADYGKDTWFSDNKSQFTSKRFTIDHAYGLGEVKLANLLNAMKKQAESQWKSNLSSHG